MSGLVVGTQGNARFRARGRALATGRLEEALLAPLADAAAALLPIRPRQDLLSGVHNPFGRASAFLDSWAFLAVCERTELLDAVAELLGPDLVLWDSELYLKAEDWDAARAREGRHWPADPLAGVVADVALASRSVILMNVCRASGTPQTAPGAHYIIRYMPATSLYNRDPCFSANRLAMEERPLVNYPNRPIWLVRGEDRAGSDFARGFSPTAPGWAADRQTFREMEV